MATYGRPAKPKNITLATVADHVDLWPNDQPITATG